MNEPAILGLARRALAASAAFVALSGCGGAVASGVAVGKLGDNLGAHARGAPQGAEACALQDALAASGSGTEKPSSETCAKALKSDLLWRKALVVLAAYGETIEALASGEGVAAGPLEGAATGVKGTDWIEVEASEQAARDAVAKLAARLGENGGKGDLGKLVTDVGPHVKTLCDGLVTYLDAQTRTLADVQRELDKKRTSRTDRRCAQLDGRSVCVGESVIDRVVYADTYGRASMLESNQIDARDAVAGFCAAHKKLEAAASDGRLSKDATYTEIVEAVKAVPRTPPSGAGKPSAPAKK